MRRQSKNSRLNNYGDQSTSKVKAIGDSRSSGSLWSQVLQVKTQGFKTFFPRVRITNKGGASMEMLNQMFQCAWSCSLDEHMIEKKLGGAIRNPIEQVSPQ